MEWIKSILKDVENADALIEAINKEFPKHAVPKENYNKKVTELEDLNNRYTETEKQIKALESASSDTETLKGELSKIKTEYETYKADTAKRELNREKAEKLKAGLSKKFNPDAVDLLISTFDMDELTFNEAKEIVDLESKINRLAETKPKLVITTEAGTEKPKDGKDKDPEVDTSKMTDSEYFAFKRSQEKGD